jgi:hypothetical protein
MTIQWSQEILDRFVAPGIHDFVDASIPELKESLRGESDWLFNHFLTSAFQHSYGEPMKSQIFNIIYRASTAIAKYRLACNLTLNYARMARPGSPNIPRHFEALCEWETCLLNWQVGVQVFNRISIDDKVYRRGDDSIDERANELANTVKHAGGTTSAIPRTVPMWLAQSGFVTEKGTFPYISLATLIEQMGDFAIEIAKPVK